MYSWPILKKNITNNKIIHVRQLTDTSHFFLVEIFFWQNFPPVSFSANVYYRYRVSRCIFSSSKLSGVVYFDNYYFNKYLFVQFDSTLGRFVGFNNYGIKLAELWNNGSYVHFERDMVEVFCKYNSQIFENNICDKAGMWHKRLLWSLPTNIFLPFVIFTSCYY